MPTQVCPGAYRHALQNLTPERGAQRRIAVPVLLASLCCVAGLAQAKPPHIAVQDRFVLRCPAHSGGASEARLSVTLQLRRTVGREAPAVHLVVSDGTIEQFHAHVWPAGAPAGAVRTLTIDVGSPDGPRHGHERHIGYAVRGPATVRSAQLQHRCAPGPSASALVAPPSVIGAAAPEAGVDAWRSEPLPHPTRVGPAFSD